MVRAEALGLKKRGATPPCQDGPALRDSLHTVAASTNSHNKLTSLSDIASQETALKSSHLSASRERSG